jgi:hypothetical protein
MVCSGIITGPSLSLLLLLCAGAAPYSRDCWRAACLLPVLMLYI